MARRRVPRPRRISRRGLEAGMAVGWPPIAAIVGVGRAGAGCIWAAAIVGDGAVGDGGAFALWPAQPASNSSASAARIMRRLLNLNCVCLLKAMIVSRRSVRIQ